MSFTCNLKVFTKSQPISPTACGKSGQSEKFKDWWKFPTLPTKIHKSNTMKCESNVITTTTVARCNSPKLATTHDIGKLFPRNMPSIRRSRRRPLHKSVGIGTNDDMAPHVIDHTNKSNVCKVRKVSPKMLKKRGNVPHTNAITKTAKISTPTKITAIANNKATNYVCKTQLRVKKTKKHLQVCNSNTLVNATTKDIPAMSLNSQQSSLISYDLSISPTSQKNGGSVEKTPFNRLMADEMFHSSGVSCNDETPSECSYNSLDLAKLQRSNFIYSSVTEEALIEAEVAELTDNLTSATNKYPKANSSKCRNYLAVSELQNLYTCRNRNPLWLHSMADRNARRNDDDIQLSDLEEQLALVHGQSKTNLSRSATHKK